MPFLLVPLMDQFIQNIVTIFSLSENLQYENLKHGAYGWKSVPLYFMVRLITSGSLESGSSQASLCRWPVKLSSFGGWLL